MADREPNRTIFLVLMEEAEPGSVSGTVRYTPTFTLPASTPLREIVTGCIGSYRALAAEVEGRSQSGPDAAPPADAEIDPEAYALHDAEAGEVPLELNVGGVPKPGVLILVPLALSERGPFSSGMLAMAAWRFVQERSDALRRFLATHHADVEPTRDFKLDVFLSYANQDQVLATEIHQALTRAGLRSFMASKTIDAGSDWGDALLQALRDTRTVVVLLTPNSVSSPWVLTEAGAIWALGKPVIPAVAYVKAAGLPGPLSQYQARPVETPRQMKLLVGEVTRLCRAEPATRGSPPKARPVSTDAPATPARRRRAAASRDPVHG